MMNKKKGSMWNWEIRRRTAVRASCFAALVLSVLLAPSVSALTVLDSGDGSTVYNESSCTADVAAPVSQDVHIPSGGEAVRVPMRVQWDDWRTPPGEDWESLFVIQAWYQSTEYRANYPKFTGPGDKDDDSFFKDVPGVQQNTYMTVYYHAYVYDAQGNTQCSDGAWTVFHFIP
jgi:hypothetical protein